MAISEKQKELDAIKWLKSEEMGADACGTFDYCKHCNKNQENPCAKAYEETNAKPVKVAPAKAAAKKPAAKKAPAKKAPAKKPAAKKAPAKKK